MNASGVLWLVGQYRGEGAGGVVWDFQGVFSSEARARAACRTDRYFIAPATLDGTLPDDVVDWPGLYYPLAGEAC